MLAGAVRVWLCSLRLTLCSPLSTARAAVWVDGAHFNTLRLGEGARAVLKGEQSVSLKLQSHTRTAPASTARARSAAHTLPLAARETLAALKAWRAEVAREHNLPAYVIFHDATLEALAQRLPRTLADLQGIPGLGQKKLQAYGEEVLRVLERRL